METPISKFHERFYIPAMKNLAYHLPYLRIFGTNHCGKETQREFHNRDSYEYVKHQCDYAEQSLERLKNPIYRQC